MQITIKNKKNCDLTTICPICKKKTDIQYTDYIQIHPMIWCWNCRDESKFVINCSIEDLELMEQDESCTSKTFDLLMVKRIVNTPDDYNFLNIYNKKHNTSFEEPDELEEYMNISHEKYINMVFDEVGVELNSYNIADIKKTIPDYDISHDGSVIYIEVIEKDGHLNQMAFWGD